MDKDIVLLYLSIFIKIPVQKDAMRNKYFTVQVCIAWRQLKSVKNHLHIILNLIGMYTKFTDCRFDMCNKTFLTTPPTTTYSCTKCNSTERNPNNCAQLRFVCYYTTFLLLVMQSVQFKFLLIWVPAIMYRPHRKIWQMHRLR